MQKQSRSKCVISRKGAKAQRRKGAKARRCNECGVSLKHGKERGDKHKSDCCDR